MRKLPETLPRRLLQGHRVSQVNSELHGKCQVFVQMSIESLGAVFT